jgi:8-oxo-dGTP diphosphatase
LRLTTETRESAEGAQRKAISTVLSLISYLCASSVSSLVSVVNRLLAHLQFQSEQLSKLNSLTFAFYLFTFSLYISERMLKKVLGALWRHAPKSARRWGVRLVEPRFTVTAGAVITDDEGRVLLLNHVFRMGSGWGIPGGFIEKGEQPEEALRRELREEIGMELEHAEIAFVRTLKKPSQVEIIFRCRARGNAASQSIEIKSAEWFTLDRLPPGLPSDQHHLIGRVLGNGAKPPD